MDLTSGPIRLMQVSQDAGLLRLGDGPLRLRCRKVYEIEMQRLKWRHLNGAEPAVVTVGRSALLDRLIRALWNEAREEFGGADPAARELKRASCVALGEYGRLDLAPCSPVDLLVLVKSPAVGKPGKAISSVIEAAKSLGFEARILVLTAKECLQRAQSHFPFSFGLLGSRWVTGDAAAFQELEQRFRLSLFRNQLAFLFEMSDYLDALHEDHGASVFLTESDVKLGAGGLLDVSGLLACLRLLTGTDDPAKIISERKLAAADWNRLQDARQHLAGVRNHLHFSEGRRQDWLAHEQFRLLAEFLGRRDRRPGAAAVMFAQETFRRRKNIHDIVSRFLRQARNRLSTGPEESKSHYLKLASPLSSEVAGNTSPERWMKAFRFGQTEPALLNEEFEVAVLSQLPRWNIRSFDHPQAHSEFRLILRQKGRVGAALRKMRELGFLGRYLPEFGRLECFPQLDRPQKYTLDEEILRAIDCLDEMATSTQPAMHDYQRVLDQVADPSLIYLALLLRESKRSLDWRQRRPITEAAAAGAMRRLRVERESHEKVLLLVREHQLLAEISQRRDFDDPLILQEVCDTVETADNLNMLLLLTSAELQSLEEDPWTERKDFLLWSLYFKVFDRLMFGDEISEPEHAQVAAIQQQVLEQLAHEFETETVLRHFLLLPEKYALYTPLPQILSHVRLCERLGDQPAVTLWTTHPQAGYTELVVSTRDVPGRFAQIAGTLSSQGVSILSAQLNTRDDALVIDTFQVSDLQGKAIVDSEAWARVDRLLAAVISGEKDLQALLVKRFPASELPGAIAPAPRIRIDNDIASQSTLIEVQTQDRPGLGYQIAKTLADLGLNILSAKLATERNHVFDVFYVQTQQGEKVTSSFQMTEILERLRSIERRKAE